MATPSRLYKYRPINERTKDIIVEHRIFFSTPNMFNDVFDCQIPFDFTVSPTEFSAYLDEAHRSGQLTSAQLDTLKAKGISNLPADFVSHTRDKYQRRISRETSFFCASECSDNILMYAHYADSQRGCCLEFDPSADILLRRCEQVVYQDTPPDMNFFRLRNHSSLMARSLFLTKKTSWNYEREWRVVRNKVGAGMHDISASCLTGVIFGALTVDSDKALVRKWVTLRGIPVNFYQTRADKSSYTLVVEPIP